MKRALALLLMLACFAPGRTAAASLSASLSPGSSPVSFCSGAGDSVVTLALSGTWTATSFALKTSYDQATWTALTAYTFQGASATINANGLYQAPIPPGSCVQVAPTSLTAGTAQVRLTTAPGSPSANAAPGATAVSQSGTWTVQQGGAPWSVSQSGSPWGVSCSAASACPVNASQVGTWTSTPNTTYAPCANAGNKLTYTTPNIAAKAVVFPHSASLKTTICQITVDFSATTLALTDLQNGTGTTCGTSTSVFQYFSGATALNGSRWTSPDSPTSLYQAMPAGADVCFDPGSSVAGAFQVTVTGVQQ